MPGTGRIGSEARAILCVVIAWLGAGTICLVAGGRVEAARTGPRDVTLDASWAIRAPLDDPLLAWTARDLQDKFLRISGQRLPVLAAGSTGAPVASPSVSLEVLASPEPALGEDGFRIEITKTAVRIQANTALGVAFGAMEILERVGCRWYAPDAYRIPEDGALRLAQGSTRSVPAFAVRQIRSVSALDPEWCLRNRLNVGYTFPPGTEPRAYFGDGCHSFSRLVPPALYPREPGLFSEVAGRRYADAQLCLSNPEVRARIKAALSESLRVAPWAPALHVAQDDNLWWCECRRCNGLAARYGGQSGLLLWFLNPIARRIAREVPGRRIATLAYTYTRAPPRGIEPDPNLIVRFCNYRPHCHVHPLDACPENRGSYTDLLGWSRFTRHLHVYEYMINFRLFPLPCPNLEAMGKNLRLYRDLGVEGVYYSATPMPGAWMAELKSYLVARWLWNPDEDLVQIKEDFLAGFYGPAADAVDQLLSLTRRAVSEAGVHPDLYGYGEDNAWDTAYLESMNRVLALARVAVGQEGVPFDRRLLPLDLTAALFRAISPRRSAADIQALDRIARRLGADRLGGSLPVSWVLRGLRARLPSGQLRLAGPGESVSCVLLPGLAAHLTALAIGDRTYLDRPTEDPLRPEGLRWILDPADAWTPPPAHISLVGSSEAVVTRGLPATGCEAAIQIRLLDDPPGIRYRVGLTNPTTRPAGIPMVLSLAMAEVPEVWVGGVPRPVRFAHPLKCALIAVESGGPVCLRYPRAGVTLYVASDIRPKRLLVPPRPGEARRLLRITYGEIIVPPHAKVEHSFRVFLEENRASVQHTTGP